MSFSEAEQTHVRVNGRSYKIEDAQLLAFSRQLHMVWLEDSVHQRQEDADQRDAFLAALPAWALNATVVAAEDLAVRARELLEER